MKATFKSAVHMIITKDEKILLQKRKGSKLWPGYYALPAGHIDEGETQYDALVREAQEELGIDIDPKNIIHSYVVLRRNYFEIDGKILDPYIDYYFEIKKYEGIPRIMEKDKCDELIWADINNLPKPFVNYEGAFLENRNITAYDCRTDGAYIKEEKKKEVYDLNEYSIDEIIELAKEGKITPANLTDSGICPTCFDRENGNVLYGSNEDKVFYEDDRFECFLAGNPRALGHVIISTKKHFKDMLEIDDRTCMDIFVLAKEVMNVIKNTYGAESVYLCTMCDGKMNHFHLQLIPRYEFEKRGSENFVKPRFEYIEDKEKLTKIKQLMRE